jgi:predicted  nucleic acid-binding Zn-ribbon protein
VTKLLVELETSDIFGKLKSGAGRIAEEAEETVRVKRIEMQIGSIKNQIDDQYKALGRMIYDGKLKGEAENPETPNIITKITELKQQIVAKEEEIKNIKEGTVGSQAATTGAATTGKRFCTKCGKENDSSSKFCTCCGAEMG